MIKESVRKLLLGILYLLIVATVMSSFELIFFCLIIAPTETLTIEGSLENNHIIQIPPSADIEDLYFNNFTNNYFDIAIERENLLITSYNESLILFIVIEISILVLFIGLTYKVYYNHEGRFSDCRFYALYHSIGTILILCIFQLNMYYFALDYQYITPEELQLLVYNKLLSSLAPGKTA